MTTVKSMVALLVNIEQTDDATAFDDMDLTVNTNIPKSFSVASY